MNVLISFLHDLKAEVRNFNLSVDTTEHRMAGFQLGAPSQNAEIDQIKARLDRVGRRLDLRDRPRDCLEMRRPKRR